MKGSFAGFLSPTRKIAAKLQVEDPRLRFAQFTMPTVSSTVHDAAFSATASAIIQFAVVGSNLYQHNISIGGGGWNASAAWSNLCVANNVAISQDAKYLVYSRGTSVYYRLMTGTTPGAEISLFTSPVPNFSFLVRPSSVAEFGVCVFTVTDTTGAGSFVCKIEERLFSITGGFFSIGSWGGYVSMDSLTPPVVDSVGNMIFMTDHSGKRTLWLEYNSFINSDTGNALQLDITDDTSFFRLTGACLGLDGLAYITGVLSRQYSRPMTIYTACDPVVKTEAEFTFGRDMYVISKNTDTDTEGIGKPVSTSVGMFYLSSDRLLCAQNGTSTHSPFGWDNANAVDVSTVSSIGVSFNPNQPSSMTSEISSQDASVNYILPGSTISVLASANGDAYERIGLFGVDQFDMNVGPMGKSSTIRGSSLAMKKLGEWTSDSAYDYWSQSKVWSDAKDLTTLTRKTGQWTEQVDGLDLKDLNVDGVLYTVERASDGCSVRAKFMRKSGVFDARFGLIVNYQKETMAQAAARIPKAIEKVTDAECGVSGIFVIHSEGEFISGYPQSGFAVYLYNSLAVGSPWSQIGGYEYGIPRDTWKWLMVNFRDGVLSIYVADDGSSRAWERVDWGYCFTYPTQPGFPIWDRDTNGRAGVYVRNVTPYSTGYPFASDSTVVPVADSSVFPTADILLVDEEQISYTGKSANNTVGPLDFKFGREIVAQPTTTLANPYNFSIDRHTNGLKQTFVLPGTRYIRGVFLKIGKVGYPEDGLEVRIYGGTENNSTSAFGNLKASATVDTSQILDVSKITTTNGWIFFSFYSKVEVVNGDRIFVTRSNNGTHPNAASYYVTWLTPSVPNMKLYRWGNQDYIDNSGIGYYEIKVSTLSCAMPFKLIGYNDEPGGMGAVCVTTIGGLSVTDNYYNNHALVVTDGSGAGTTFRITGYKYAADVSFIYIESSPGFSLDETTKLKIVPALYGLTRLSQTSHSQTQVNIYRAEPLLLIGKFGYFSKELDRSLRDYVNTICWKAGVKGVSAEMAYPTLINANTNTAILKRRNLIFRTLPDNSGVGAGGNVANYFFRSNVSGNIGLSLSSTDATYVSSDLSTEVFLYPFMFDHPSSNNWVTISLYDKYLSIWQKNTLVHTFVLTDADAALLGEEFTVSGTCTVVNMDVPEACVRIDNYVLDIGKNGTSMIEEIVGNKRFYYQDDQNGGLRLFRNRSDVNTSGTSYLLATEYSEVRTDTGKATRVLLEGGLVVERFDPLEMRDHGNLFSRMNIFEIMNVDDAKWFADKVLYEYSTMDTQVRVRGAAWPAIETEDAMYITVPEGLKHIIIDTMTVSFAVNESEALAEMELSGRLA